MVKQSTLRKKLGQGNRTREQAAHREDIVTEERVMAYITNNLSTC